MAGRGRREGQLERKSSKFLLEESVICENKQCKLKLFGDCIEVVTRLGDDSLQE